VKTYLLLGKTRNMDLIKTGIEESYQSNCIQMTSFFNAVKILYEKHIDTLVISSKAIKEEKLDFLEFIRNAFASIKIFITFDNGLDVLQNIPEDIKIVTENNIAEIIKAI